MVEQHPSQSASHRRQPAQGGGVPRQIGRARGGLNSKLHAICDGDGKPVVLRLTAGQVSDYRGADTGFEALPEADVLIADKGYDSDRWREALAERGVKSCIPGRANRKEPIIYDSGLSSAAIFIERLFGRLKDWRRIARDMIAARTPSTAPSVLPPRLSSDYES